MTSSADAWWRWLGLPAALLARFASAAESPAPPRAFAERVAAAVAAAWDVPPADVRLEWGRASDVGVLGPETPFRLLGRGESGWYVVVARPGTPDAVALQVRAGVERRVPVARRPLREGEHVTAADTHEELRVHWGAPEATAEAAPADGWRVRRAIAAGEALAWPAVERAPLVEAGEPVTIAWRRNGVRVTVAGVALNSAGPGEPVRARIADRPARLVARVTGRGTAELTGGER